MLTNERDACSRAVTESRHDWQVSDAPPAPFLQQGLPSLCTNYPQLAVDVETLRDTSVLQQWMYGAQHGVMRRCPALTWTTESARSKGSIAGGRRKALFHRHLIHRRRGYHMYLPARCLAFKATEKNTINGKNDPLSTRGPYFSETTTENSPRIPSEGLPSSSTSSTQVLYSVHAGSLGVSFSLKRPRVVVTVANFKQLYPAER